MNTVPLADVFEIGLDSNAANYAALTPLTFIERAAAVYPEHVALVYGEVRRSWAETYGRCCQLASALELRGIGKGDTVAVIASNIPEIFEAHFGVPMIGAVLNTLNTRLDSEALAFTLQHGEAKAILVDPEFADVAERAVHISGRKMLVVDIEDASFEGGRRIGQLTYEQLLAEGDTRYAWAPPGDEWEAIALNYTSGTTGDPKGVVYHHRGAYLNAVSNVLSWGMGQHPVYLWTLPMFHCNGWCFPWTLAAVAGTNVCLRHVRADAILNAIRERAGLAFLCRTHRPQHDQQRAGRPEGGHRPSGQGDDGRLRAARAGDRGHGADGLRGHPGLWADRDLRAVRRERLARGME